VTATYTRAQALAVRDRVMAHVGAIQIDKADPGLAGPALDGLHAFLSLVSTFTGKPVVPDEWRRHWSQTLGIVVAFATELSDEDVALVAAHEAVHVQQFKGLGLTGAPADGYTAAMWVVYLFSREGRARLEAEAYAIMLEIGVVLLGWDHARARGFITWVRDVALPNYALAVSERELVAAILDSQATALFSGTHHTSALGVLVVKWSREAGVGA